MFTILLLLIVLSFLNPTKGELGNMQSSVETDLVGQEFD